jgi:predicted metal-binding protein
MNVGDFERYQMQLTLAGATDVRLIDTQSVVTAPWVRLKCQFGCPVYGKGHGCPPNSPTFEQTRAILDSYSTAILAHAQFCYVKKEPIRKTFPKTVVAVEGDLFKDGYYKAFSMISGPCSLCKECSYLTGESCLLPEQARPSMESCGIDVYQTARNNGLPLKPLRSKDDVGDHYYLILVE